MHRTLFFINQILEQLQLSVNVEDIENANFLLQAEWGRPRYHQTGKSETGTFVQKVLAECLSDQTNLLKINRLDVK